MKHILWLFYFSVPEDFVKVAEAKFPVLLRVICLLCSVSICWW